MGMKYNLKRKVKLMTAVALLSTTLFACEYEEVPSTQDAPSIEVETVTPNPTPSEPEEFLPEDTSPPEESGEEEFVEEEQETPPTEENQEEVEEPEDTLATESEENSKLVVIDPGHQAYGNSAQEPIGPGATTTKAKVTSGTTGRFTGVPEYVLNLEVSLKLRDVLESMGYDVIMIRENHDIDMSNSERAAIANEATADAFIRIHANGDDNASVNGAFTICPTANNPYCPQIYTESRLLSEMVLDGFIEATGAYRRAIWETDTMSGINWCTVPVTIIEMGFMTNEREDRLMATEEYQQSMAEGMAEGIRRYFEAVDNM